MDYSPKFSAANNSIPLAPKEHPAKKWIRRILLAIVVAVALLTLCWFLYDKFFLVSKIANPYDASRAGIANTLRSDAVPVPVAVRNEIGNNIRANSPAAITTKSGQIINTANLQQRQIISNFLRPH